MAASDYSSSVPADLVKVAYILGAYGLQGQVRVRTFSPESPLATIKTWWISADADNPKVARDAQLKSCREHSGDLLASFAFSQDRGVAESLRGHTIWIARHDFPDTDEDEFYWVDLEGCDVYVQPEEGGEPVYFGVVDKLSDNAAHGILHIHRYALDSQGQKEPLLTKRGATRESLVPFVKAHVLDVDTQNHKILIDWPLED